MPNPFQHKQTRIDRGRTLVDNNLEARTLDIDENGHLVISSITGYRDNNGNLIDVDLQNPLPTDSDSVYIKDIDFTKSDFTDWTGDNEAVFQSPFSTSITNATADNPKEIIIAFHRTVNATQIGLGENNGGNFSNVKILLLGSAGAERSIYDASDSDVKKTSLNAVFGDELFNSIKIQFHTADEVSLSNITIQKAAYVVNGNNPLNPIPISLDSVYSKDLDLSRSEIDGWAGDIQSVFEGLLEGVNHTGATNPKVLIFYFKRTVVTNSLGLGSEGGGNFSNAKIIALLSGGATYTLYDGSADVTKRTSQTIQFMPLGFVGVRVEFHTADTITLTNFVILKTISVVSRLQALKPDGTVVNIDATNGGNLKISLEEIEDQIGTDNNTRLMTAPYIIDEFANVARLLGDNIFKGSLIAIPPEHHEIHCGDSYTSLYSEDLGNGASQTLAIIIPNEGLTETEEGDDQTTKQYHVIFYIDTEAEATFIAYEGATLSANGTAIPIKNRNRNSSRVDYIGFYYAPTVTDNGSVVYPLRRVGAGRTTGGELGRGSEFIMKDNTIYLFTITNAVTTSNYFNFELSYYVHPGV